MERVRAEFDKLPSSVKVIIYSGVSVLLSQIVFDLSKLDNIWAPYFITIVTIGVNITSYLVLRVKGETND